MIKGLKKIALRALTILLVTVFSAGVFCSYSEPTEVFADEELYSSLYDVFKDRSGDPDNFMSPERFVWRLLYYCEILNEVDYTYGSQEHNLACDGFVSLALRLTFCTAHEFARRPHGEYECKFYWSEEHTVAASPVDKYEIFRPGGTTVTWIYNNYVNTLVDPIVTRDYVADYENGEWVDYLAIRNVQPGDILIWDNDNDSTYWTHIGIYAGNIDGVAMMWHASAIKGEVCLQSLEEITSVLCCQNHVSILPSTNRPARVNLSVSTSLMDEDSQYTVYGDYLEKTECKGTLSAEQISLDRLAIYPNDAKDGYERVFFIVKEPVSDGEEGEEGEADNESKKSKQEVFKLIVKIESGTEDSGTLTYSIYGNEDDKLYGRDTIENFDCYKDMRFANISKFI